MNIQAAARRVARRWKIAFRVKQFEKLLSKGKRFGVLSAYGAGSKSQNKIRHGELVADLQRLGYRYEPLKGSWEGVTEKSVLVHNIKFQDLLRLGEQFEQDAVIYKDRSGSIGMYYQKNGTAEMAVRPDGEMAAEVKANPELYSKARGLSFEFGFLWGQEVPWNKLRPFTKDDIQDIFVAEAAEAA